jgi:hypothetical protein
VRDQQRPRFGFYVDHLVDAFGALFLLTGLAVSGLVGERVAMALLVIYFLFSINMYLGTISLGVFKISYGLLGGTELRILLILVNLVVLARPGSISSVDLFSSSTSWRPRPRWASR